MNDHAIMQWEDEGGFALIDTDEPSDTIVTTRREAMESAAFALAIEKGNGQ